MSKEKKALDFQAQYVHVANVDNEGECDIENINDDKQITSNDTDNINKNTLTDNGDTDNTNNGDVHVHTLQLTEHGNTSSKTTHCGYKIGTQVSKKNVFRYKLMKTILIIVSWIINGLILAIKFPTFSDLCERTGSDVEEMTRATAMRNIGYIIGCIAGGLLFDRFRKAWDLQLSFGFLLLALSIAFKPWCRNIPSLAILYWLEGAAHGIFGIAGNGMMIATWGSNTPAPLQAMHFGGKVGGLVAPALAYPFLSSTRGEHVNVNASVAYNVTDLGSEFSSKIEIPYIICGVLGVVTSLGYFAVYLAPRPRGLTYTNMPKGRNLRDILRPGSFTNGNTRYGVILMTCMVLYFSITGAFSSHFQLLQAPIATETLHATKQEASLMQFAARGSAIIGQFLLIPIAKVVPTSIIVFVECHSVAIINIVAVGLALKSRMNFAIIGAAFEFFYTTIWALGMTWPEVYMEVTGSAIMIWSVGCGLGNAIFEWGSGFILQYHGAHAVMWLNAAFSIAICVLIYVTQCVMSYHGPKKRLPVAF